MKVDDLLMFPHENVTIFLLVDFVKATSGEKFLEFKNNLTFCLEAGISRFCDETRELFPDFSRQGKIS